MMTYLSRGLISFISSMRRFLLIALIILCLLLTACGEAKPKVVNNGDQSATNAACKGQDGGICLAPHELRVAYGVDSLIQKGDTGKEQTIVDITSFTSSTMQQDVATFDHAFNLPPVDVKVISPLNEPMSDPNNDKDAWASGTERDVEIIHALAPDAKIVVLQSSVAQIEGTVGLPEFRKLDQYAIDHHLGNIVVHRWDASELTLQNDQAKQELQSWDTLLQQGTTQDHITYLGSSGSYGATNLMDDHNLASNPAVSFPADSPWVTGVGSTILKTKGSTFYEIAASDSGGGFSSLYPIPSYQQLLPNKTQTQFSNHRGIPDVSASGDPSAGLAVYLQGKWTIASGNSGVPIWAAITAIANQMAGHPLGFLNPALYKLAVSPTYHQDFRDVTEGDNSNSDVSVVGYTATTGWDAATGLGTPNAEKLIPDLIAATK